jgi:hypothetical protein
VFEVQQLQEHSMLPHPTRMPSSMSVGATLSPRPTTNCKFADKKVDMLYNTRLTKSPSHAWQVQQPGGSPTFAICFTLITYLASSVPGLMIFVQRAT